MDLREMVEEEMCDDLDLMDDDDETVTLGHQGRRPNNKGPDNQISGSVVWKYYTKSDVGGTCKCCRKVIPTGKTGTTTGLIRHLSSHAAIYGRYLEDKKKQANSKQKPKNQPDIVSLFNKQTRLDPKSTRALALTQAIGTMMAVDYQPYSLVSDKGFKNLMKIAEPRYDMPSRTTFSRQIIPALYNKVKVQVKDTINLHQEQGLASIALTTDGWTSRANQGYISLTAHYISKDFEAVHIVLANSHLPGTHTAEHLLAKLKSLVTEWGIDDHTTIPIYVVSDNAKNIQAAINRSDWEPVQCFAHTLQLVIVDALQEVAGFVNVCKKGRAIVGHYKRSSSALNRLEACQLALHLPAHSLIQDVDTRWNSQYAMLQRLVEQRPAISAELADGSRNIDNLTNSEWMLAEGSIDVLEPLDRATREVCSEEYPTRSMIIPLLHCIEKKILSFITSTATNADKHGITFARSIDRKLKARFPNYKRNVVNMLSMVVDPRFKLLLFTEEFDKLWAINLLSIECKHVQQKVKENQLDLPTLVQDPVAGPSSSKSTSLWEDFESLKERVAHSSEDDQENAIANEIKGYITSNPIPRTDSPFDWWKLNSLKYPTLKDVARKFLGIPASQVASERLFSTSGNIVTTRRECLDPERVDQLCFLHANINI